MRFFSTVLSLVGLLAALPVYAGQKTIPISDSLAANAERFKVKMGPQWFGQIHKWGFGDYAVVSSKMGWSTTTTSSNLLNTETESNSASKFSFALGNKTTDVATVNAAHDISVQTLKKLALGNGFFLGADEVLQDSDNFTAFVSINGDTAETWALFVGATRAPVAEGSHQTSVTTTAFLTNGTRRIALAPASTIEKGGHASLFSAPALGVEFTENGQSLCALQYMRVTLPAAPGIVWILRSLDARMKLTLAAAMTAILQMKSAEGGPVQPGPE